MIHDIVWCNLYSVSMYMYVVYMRAGLLYMCIVLYIYLGIDYIIVYLMWS